MKVSPLRRATFMAAWEIQRMMWGPGMFVETFENERQVSGKQNLLTNGLRHSDRQKPGKRWWVEPDLYYSYHRHPVFTKRGLILTWHNGFPFTIKTPWGEWHCFEAAGPGLLKLGYADGLKEKELFLSRVELYEEQNRQRNLPPICDDYHFIRRVGDFELPYPDITGGYTGDPNEFPGLAAEWVHLCETTGAARYPIPGKYVEADLPLPELHPDREHFLDQYRGRDFSNWHFAEKGYLLRHYPEFGKTAA